jgi:peptidoglycan hydrolase CwlO-like protein
MQQRQEAERQLDLERKQVEASDEKRKQAEASNEELQRELEELQNQLRERDAQVPAMMHVFIVMNANDTSVSD